MVLAALRIALRKRLCHGGVVFVAERCEEHVHDKKGRKAAAGSAAAELQFRRGRGQHKVRQLRELVRAVLRDGDDAGPALPGCARKFEYLSGVAGVGKE